MNTDLNNIAHLCGTVESELEYSHDIFGESFYVFKLKVERLSGQADILPVTVSERLMNEEIKEGQRLSVDGQVRSYNIVHENKSKLVLQLFAKEVYLAESGLPDENSIYLQGFVCKKPVYRVTPFSREITDLLLAVNRAYGKSDYIPCICWGRNARYCENLEVGQFMSITGRLQSRQYQKKLEDGSLEERTAYEVSVAKLCLTQEENDILV